MQWQPGVLTIHTKRLFLGAGFLGAPPISLKSLQGPCQTQAKRRQCIPGRARARGLASPLGKGRPHTRRPDSFSLSLSLERFVTWSSEAKATARIANRHLPMVPWVRLWVTRLWLRTLGVGRSLRHFYTMSWGHSASTEL